MEEIWKDIPGYEGHFQCSNYGRIKSLERIYTCGNGSKRLQKEIYLKLIISCWGYYMVSLGKDNIRKTFLLHRIVAKLFIPNPENLETVNHINGNKLDNTVLNLEWSSKIDNYRHAQDNGLIPYKIQNDEVLEIKRLYHDEKYTQKKIAEMFGINPCHVSRIVNDKRRKRANLSTNKNNKSCL